MTEDIPDILLSLVLIGLDKTTPNELRANLNSALDSICQAIDTQTVSLPSRLRVTCLSIPEHISIHRRLLSFASTLTPANKAHFVSFFSSGSGRTRHIAQWLAYALLLPESVPSVCISTPKILCCVSLIDITHRMRSLNLTHSSFCFHLRLALMSSSMSRAQARTLRTSDITSLFSALPSQTSSHMSMRRVRCPTRFLASRPRSTIALGRVRSLSSHSNYSCRCWKSHRGVLVGIS